MSKLESLINEAGFPILDLSGSTAKKLYDALFENAQSVDEVKNRYVEFALLLDKKADEVLNDMQDEFYFNGVSNVFTKQIF